MSSSTPFHQSGQPEFLSSHEPAQTPKPGRKKAAALGAVGVVVAAAVGAGAWAVTQLVGGGPGAAAVLPDNALVYASLDLDPSASQKIEALKTIKKFPALDEELDLGSRDDLRRYVFAQIVEDGECDGLDYGEDIEPWIGDKLGVAAVPGDKEPDVVVALQVRDEAKAEKGIASLFQACAPGDTFGVEFLDGYALVAETDTIAKAARSAAEKSALADSAAYTEAVDRLGSLGIASVYVSPDGPKALSESLMEEMGGTSQGMAPPSAEQQQKLDEMLADFKGLAATVRFENGGVELAAAGEGVPSFGSQATTLADLPGSTVAALGFSLPEGWTKTVEAQLGTTFGPEFFDQMMAEAEAQTGLQLPEDLEKAFGKESLIALDGSTDFGALVHSDDPTSLKAGIRVASEEEDVRRIISAILGVFGASDSDLVKVAAGGGHVAVGFDEDYVGKLLDGGDLGSSQTFQDAVAEPDKAKFALFVDFDAADGWLERFVASTGGGDDDVANAKPLDALGVSAWADGDTSHFVLRLSTD